MKVVATIGDGSEDKQEINLVFTKHRLGWGAFGPVLEAEVLETGERVAVKRVRSNNSVEREYLKALKHCNIIKLLYYFRSNADAGKFEYLVTERIYTSLQGMYVRSLKLSLFDVKLYMYQLLRSVAYIHHKGICHRDIKPGNILIHPLTGVLKLCDFGMSANLSLKEENSIRVGTPQYNAPELLLGFKNYTRTVDVWAVGCVLVELLKGKRELFERESNYTDQLSRIIDVFGTLSNEQFPGLLPYYQFEKLPEMEAKPWAEIIYPYPYPIPDDVISLCSGMLCYTPNSRIPPHKALAHKFFDELRSPQSIFLDNGNPFPPLFNFYPEEFAGDFIPLIPSHIRTSTLL